LKLPNRQASIVENISEFGFVLPKSFFCIRIIFLNTFRIYVGAMKALRKQGRIINLASVSALRGAPQSATRFAAAVFLASDRASHRHGDPSWWRHSHDIAADIAADPLDSGRIFGGVTGFGGRHDDDADVVAADRRGPGGLEIAAARVMFPVFSRR
jgi:hypothetical protein